jgi:hypothetical protein
MADESKTETKKKAAPAAKAAKPAKAGKAGLKAKAAEPYTGPTCRADKCKQPVRAKGYCRKHFMGWRRGTVGADHRYKSCSKEACLKPRAKGGLCAEHAGIAAPAAEAGGAA